MISTKQNGYQPNPCGIENPVPPKTGSNVDFALYHKKQLIRFCKKFHKDCYRLIGQKMALKDKVAELEQKLEQTEKDLADYQFNYPTIKELEKENAELKKQQFTLRNERNTFLAQNEQYEKDLIDFNEQLTKARELLNEFMRISKASDEVFEHDYSELIRETEQFIKDLEK